MNYSLAFIRLSRCLLDALATGGLDHVLVNTVEGLGPKTWLPVRVATHTFFGSGGCRCRLAGGTFTDRGLLHLIIAFRLLLRRSVVVGRVAQVEQCLLCGRLTELGSVGSQGVLVGSDEACLLSILLEVVHLSNFSSCAFI